MKINWGTAIAITIICFIGFIMYFVVVITTNKKYNHDLVSSDYYQKEVSFQKDIDAISNAKSLKQKILITKNKEGLKIFFPKKFISKETKGKVFLYRPSNKLLDFEIPISLTKKYLLVPEKLLLDGLWNITVSWKYKGKEYLYKEEIMY